jgi:hypothetical protein
MGSGDNMLEGNEWWRSHREERAILVGLFHCDVAVDEWMEPGDFT